MRDHGDEPQSEVERLFWQWRAADVQASGIEEAEYEGFMADVVVPAWLAVIKATPTTARDFAFKIIANEGHDESSDLCAQAMQMTGVTKPEYMVPPAEVAV